MERTATSQPATSLLPLYVQPVEEKPQSILVPINCSTSELEPMTLPFIEANTKEVSTDHLQKDCIIPVFSKDNEVTISHQSFIAAIMEAAYRVFPFEKFSNPAIRVSHIVKGRIPEAIHKPVSQLLDTDKTIYYERMMFCFDIPTIHQDIAGCTLNLTIGGVRAYNEQNLYAKKSPERFKVFIGFKNLVCCNLCVTTDGYMSNLRVMDVSALVNAAEGLFRSYAMEQHLALMTAYQGCNLTESQFAQFLGRSRMYQYLSSSEKKHIPELLMTDTQINLVARSYYDDEHFGKQGDSISLWQLYNLFTGANKSSYIDNFLDRASNATDLTTGLARALRGDPTYSWFIQ
ncbi:MAG: DUF3871 family protein [Spirochaetales bacterium]|nr:DUF3871 family protein [Spirochaetales bacterium]